MAQFVFIPYGPYELQNDSLLVWYFNFDI